MTNDYSEDTLVEQPAIELFAQLDYETANCFREQFGAVDSTYGRETPEEVILPKRLRQALEKLNQGMQRDAIDLVENFSLFDESRGGLAKIVAKNHQFLGVNNAVSALEQIKENQGRLGVFWHTQGSGKSFSMAFFSQKILRKLPGNWTFLVVTDRNDLDSKIYKNFRNTGVVTEDCQAESGPELKQLLTEDHRFIFTLIQKFGTKNGEAYPKLSDRGDIIVMTDEAHRSQYDTLALNMRNALPNAAFIGFTGTPLMAGEEKTKEVFGDYVSIYNFQQSIEDGAILTKPEIDMTAKEKQEVKKVARNLLQTLKEAKLVLDWRKKQRSRADVYATVKTVLDELPRAYTPELYQQKCDIVYQHVYDSYQGEGASIYAHARR